MLFHGYCIALGIAIILVGVFTGIDWLIVAVSLVGCSGLFVVSAIDDHLYERRQVKQLRKEIEEYEKAGRL